MLNIQSTLDMLQKTHNGVAIEILLLIGQTSNGLSLEDLENIFLDSSDEIDVEKVLFSIEETSLIFKDSDTNNFKLQNFFTKYVEFKMNEDKHNQVKYNTMLISYYLEMLTKAKKYVSEGSCDIEELFRLLENHEKNILHCLKCLITSVQDKGIKGE